MTHRDKIFEDSKQSAIACLKHFPHAGIVYRGFSKESNLPWKSTDHHLTEKQIRAHRKGLFAVKLETLGFSIIDFDIEGPAHPKGIKPDEMNRLIKAWDLTNYAWTQKTPSGGSHFIFKDHPVGIKKGEMGDGIDYLVHYLLGLYQPILWHYNKELLKPFPTLALEHLKQYRANKAKSKPQAGHGKTNQHLNSGFETYIKGSPREIGREVFKIVDEYIKNPGKTGVEEAQIKLGRSIIDGIEKRKEPNLVLPEIKTMRDIENKEPSGWHVPDWIPHKGLIILSADKSTGKTSVLFSIAEALTSGVGWGNNKEFFKTPTPINHTLFCYVEREEAYYKKLWEAHCGNPDKLSPWKWISNKKQEELKTANWTKEALREYLKRKQDAGHPTKLLYLDRADMVVHKNEKFAIRDAMMELDELSYEFEVLIVVTRHTSKPQGQDKRQFRERTDGFKEWQHTASLCFMLHAHGDRLLLFKQYANQCSSRGLIEFEWVKQDNGLVIPKYRSHNLSVSADEIESQYNPQRGQTKRTSQAEITKTHIACIFKNIGKLENIAISVTPDNVEKRWIYTLTKEQILKLTEDRVSWSQVMRIIKQDLYGGFIGHKSKGDVKWFVVQTVAVRVMEGAGEGWQVKGEKGWKSTARKAMYNIKRTRQEDGLEHDIL